MTEKSEWQFLVDYLKDDTTDFYNDACQNQLVPCGPRTACITASMSIQRCTMQF